MEAMTPEAQRIAIAEACGWQGPHHPENVAGMKGWWSQDRGVWWVTPQRERVMIGSVPDYLNDLNAMHAAEEVLTTGELRAEFQMHLGFLAMKEDNRAGEWFLVHSTAAQRAEAFLRTLSLWQE